MGFFERIFEGNNSIIAVVEIRSDSVSKSWSQGEDKYSTQTSRIQRLEGAPTGAVASSREPLSSASVTIDV